MIKMVAIDLDGTLYNSKKEITEPVRQALMVAIDAGLEIVIITGRGMLGAEFALNQLGIDLPYISSAGASIRSGKGGKSIGSWPFYSPAEMEKLIGHCERFDIAMLGESTSGSMIWYGSEKRYGILDPKTRAEIELGLVSNDPRKDLDQPLLKITLGADLPLLRRTCEFMEQECPSLFYVVSSHIYLDATHKQVNKGFGLLQYAAYKNVEAAEVAMIGDQEIDLMAFEVAGLSIAMENAVPAVKSAADLVAPSNDEDGVAWALQKILSDNNNGHI